MPFKFNDLTLSGVVSDATDSADGVSFEMVVTASERKQLQGLCVHAGRVQSYSMALGESFSFDPTGGLNTLYVSSGATTQTDSGWFAVRSVSDSWGGLTTYARMRLDLARLSGPDNALGETNASTQFLSHDF